MKIIQLLDNLACVASAKGKGKGRGGGVGGEERKTEEETDFLPPQSPSSIFLLSPTPSLPPSPSHLRLLRRLWIISFKHLKDSFLKIVDKSELARTFELFAAFALLSSPGG